MVDASAEPPTHPTSAMSVATQPPPQAAVARILLVEDNPGDAALVEAILAGNEADPYEVEHVTRVADAVARLRESPFTLIVLDLSLPDSNGMDTLRSIQQAADSTPVVVLTGQTDLEAAADAIRLGAQDCLTKGIVSGELLVRAVRHAVVRRQALDAAHARALTDELTGLANRRGLFAHGEPLLKSAARLGTPLSVLYIDLNDFKTINDTLGHAAGDEALRTVARLLRETFRETDLLARVGGDEFVVVAVGASAEQSEHAVQRLIDGAAEFNVRPECRSRLNFSIGRLAFDLSRHPSLESLLTEADARMYQQKQLSKKPVLSE